MQCLACGDHSLETFKPLWHIVMGRACFLYITDGYQVYPCVIEDEDHLSQASPDSSTHLNHS